MRYVIVLEIFCISSFILFIDEETEAQFKLLP